MSLFSRRRKQSAEPAAVDVPRHVILVAVAQCRDNQGNPTERRRSHLLLDTIKSEAPVVARITTPADDMDLRWYFNHFYVRDGGERMSPGDEWVIRQFPTFASEMEADLAMDAALDEYIIVDGYRWIKAHDPVINVGPGGAVIDVAPLHQEMPVRIPFRSYSLLELDDAKRAVKDGSYSLEVSLTNYFDLVRMTRPNPTAVRRRHEQSARARRRDAAAVQELAELISDLPAETLHRAAGLFARAAVAADR